MERGAGRDGDGVDTGLKHRVGAGPLRLQGQESADALCSVGGGASGTVTEGDQRGQRRHRQGRTTEGWWQLPRHGRRRPVVGMDGGH